MPTIFMRKITKKNSTKKSHRTRTKFWLAYDGISIVTDLFQPLAIPFEFPRETLAGMPFLDVFPYAGMSLPRITLAEFGMVNVLLVKLPGTLKMLSSRASRTFRERENAARWHETECSPDRVSITIDGNRQTFGNT